MTLEPLLTSEDVAFLLKLSVKTVKKATVRARLGGFYPAGLRVLRFRPEVIRGILEGEGQGLALPLRVGQEALHGATVCRRPPPAPKTGAEKQRLADELGLRLTDP